MIEVDRCGHCGNSANGHHKVLLRNLTKLKKKKINENLIPTGDQGIVQKHNDQCKSEWKESENFDTMIKRE